MEDQERDGDVEVPRETHAEWEARVEREAAAAFEDRRVRTAALWGHVHGMRGGEPPLLAVFERGVPLLDACEAAVQLCIAQGIGTEHAVVKVPNGYVTVDFMLSVLAISGETAA